MRVHGHDGRGRGVAFTAASWQTGRMDLPSHDPNGRPLSDEARAELMALPEHLRKVPLVVALANAPVGPPLSDEERAELAECDTDGTWIPHEVVTALLAERRREGDEAAAEE